MQGSLAYLTAATHGMQEEADQLKEQLEAAELTVPSVNPSSVFLQPPPPIAQAESNWPLLTVSKVRPNQTKLIKNSSNSTQTHPNW